MKGRLISQLTQLLMPPLTDHFGASSPRRRLLPVHETADLNLALRDSKLLLA